MVARVPSGRRGGARGGRWPAGRRCAAHCWPVNRNARRTGWAAPAGLGHPRQRAPARAI